MVSECYEKKWNNLPTHVRIQVAIAMLTMVRLTLILSAYWRTPFRSVSTNTLIPLIEHGHWAYSLIAQSVKNLPVMPETQVQFLGEEDLL